MGGHRHVAGDSAIACLTPRQREVLQLVAKGFSNREIAETLSIAEHTVANHLKSVYNRLGVRRRGQATLLFLEATGLGGTRRTR